MLDNITTWKCYSDQLPRANSGKIVVVGDLSNSVFGASPYNFDYKKGELDTFGYM